MRTVREVARRAFIAVTIAANIALLPWAALFPFALFYLASGSGAADLWWVAGFVLVPLAFVGWVYWLMQAWLAREKPPG